MPVRLRYGHRGRGPKRRPPTLARRGHACGSTPFSKRNTAFLRLGGTPVCEYSLLFGSVARLSYYVPVTLLRFHAHSEIIRRFITPTGGEKVTEIALAVPGLR
jgi:hypothetical protein